MREPALAHEIPMPSKAHCQLKVRHYECDPLGHVNHAVYVNYFEVARLEAMAKAGLPFADILTQGYTVVASDLFVQYKAPAFAEELLDIRSCIAHFRGARMTWQQELFRHRDGDLLALAEVNGAFTTADGRPVRIPPSMRQLLEAVYLPDAAWGLPQPPRRLRRDRS
jgi:acyl-CoA thioester hydrolase